ncbi:hypothetical protein Tco_1044652 [Tanacetum coccineum]|uniref:Uncharacterized protein n=1 Tax=Tanacetum coccineum TaxID=301880 RepID=A0ABQ5GQJ0_9ASTR
MASNRGSSPFGTLEHTRLESCWGKFRLLVNWEDIPIEGMVEMENNRCVLLGRVSSARSTVSVEMDMLKLAPPLSRQPLDRAALMGKLLKEVLMIDELSIVETNKVNHTVEIGMLKLVVEVECFGKCVDEFDKVTVLFGEMQLKQEDRSYIHASNELHLHVVHVVPSKHESDQHWYYASL